MEIGQRVRVEPKIWNEKIREWTFEGNEKGNMYGYVGILRSLGPIPTVRFPANNNAGYWWCGFSDDEIKPVDNDPPLTVLFT